jgi:predicted RNase H-like HicB family nuclease
MVDRLFGEKEEQTIQIPVLCKFVKEDDVWNGYAEELPVAVFGSTFEEAQKNLVDAVLAHLETVQEHGNIEETIEHLRCCARARRITIEEMAFNQPLVRFNAAIHDRQITALV